jgi:hypothetical protein
MPELATSSVASLAPGRGRAPAAPAALPPAFPEFTDWVAQFHAGNSGANAAQGEALAWQRRVALRKLIQTDPAKALALAVPFGWRRELPARIARHFEQQVDGRGALNVAVATAFDTGATTIYRAAQIGGQRYQAFVFGRRLAQVCQANLPLHGIALDGQLAVQEEPLRVLSPAEAVALAQARPQTAADRCQVCGQAAAGPLAVMADLGGELAGFCGPEHLGLVNARWQLADSGGGGALLAAGGLNSWSKGPKTLLYMRVNFPDDLTEPIAQAEACAVMVEVNRFYAESSYDMTSLTPTVTPLVTLPQTKGWYSTAGPGSLLADAREAARRAGFDTANYDLDLVSHTSVPGFDWGGLGFVHGKGTWLQSMGAGVTAHELGHNYGLMHANWWDATLNSSVVGPGANLEYGNIFDTMGAAAAGTSHFNTCFKNQLGWLPEATVQDVTSNGVYRIYPFDWPSRVDGRCYAAKVRRDFSRDYWVEFRQRFTANPWLQNGVLLDWSPWGASKGGTDLLDTTPGTPTDSDSRADAAVVVGRCFSDAAAGVHLTPLVRGSTGTSAWMEVQINLGTFPSNRPPSLKLEVDLTNTAPGALVHFHAVAADPDGDALAYAWTFDDLTFSTNNLPWTYKGWSVSGDHVARCVVSDMKGAVASANALVTVGARAGFRLGGRVTDLDGAPLEGVRVDAGYTNLANYFGGYSDSDGRYVIVGVPGDLTLDAAKYGFTLTNVTGANWVTVTSDVPNLDFVGVPLPAVHLTVTTNAIFENDSTQQFFTLTRTGDTNNDLAVTLNLSGSAGVSNDYRLNLALTNTDNVVTIPAGTNRLTISFQTINDTRIEGPETATLTLLEDPAYVIAPAAEVTLTILDDDAPTRPAVAVAALTEAILENGTDRGVFRFSRSGSTDKELTVYYSVGGTATPGVDYPTLLGVLLIPSGSSTAQAQFQPGDDQNVEPDETVVVTVSPDAAYSGSGSSARVTILDDDLLTVTIYPTDDRAAEPTTPGQFTVQRAGDLTANLVVGYTIGGTASNGVDYQTLSGAVTIPAGSASGTITLTPINDKLVEGDESVILTLTNSPGYNVGTPGSASLFIRDDEKVTVTLDATDNAAAEPGSDTGLFQISRGAVKNGPLLVTFAISGTAVNGVDYVPIDSPVLIPDGASSVTVEIIAFDDLALEYTEDILLTLLPGTNYSIGNPGEGRVTIADDDANSVPAVGFTFSTSSLLESLSPGVSVSLSHTSAVPVTVDYRGLGGSAASNDFTLAPGTLTFDPGDRAKPIPLAIRDNTTVDPPRTIRLVVFNPTNATLDGLKLHTYTIVDDDTATVSVTATAAQAAETGGQAGNFRIARGGNTNASLLVNYQLTGAASAPSDYAPLGTAVTIPAGAAFVDLPVLPVDDRTVELDETVVLTLIGAPGGRIVSPHTATIALVDNDPDTRPVVTITATNQPYALEGGGNGAFVFWRSTTNGPLTLAFTLGGTANNGVDYQGLTNVLTLPAGQYFATLPVVAIDDSLIEGEEPLVLTLTDGEAYRVAYPSAATVTIQDNDQSVRLEASDFVAAEPGTDTGEFTFTRLGTTNGDLRVFFALGGTATNGVDYAAISNAITIPAGQSFVALPLGPLDDALVEGPETVILKLQTSPAYSLGAVTNGTVTIQDDEPMLTLTATVTNCIEGDPQPGVFTLTRYGDPKYDFTVRLAVGGRATYGVDYPSFLTNVYFSCGVTAIDLLIWPTNELVIEGPETVTALILPDPTYFILSPSNAVLTVTDAGTNLAPIVVITSPPVPAVFLPGTNAGLILEATVTYAGDTNAERTLLWSVVSGPDTLSLDSSNTANTAVSFTNVGVYVLRLTADDGQLKGIAQLTVVVGAVELLSSNLLHWTLDEGAGTNALDASGAGRDGVLVGAPAWSTNGVLGGALVLAGDQARVRQASGSNLLDGLQAFSVSLWLQAGSTNGDQGILTADDTGTNQTLALCTRTYASCGHSSNVIEATIPTAGGVVRHISAGNVTTNAWQHLVLVWSNGLAPALFLNGQLDQPLYHMVPALGALTNCPQFIVGQGPADCPNSWAGGIDDVRVFPRALTAGEIAALAALPPANYGPLVEAGPDQTVQLITPAVLAGMVTDDGQPVPPGALSNIWVLVRGPAPATLTNANALTNSVQFVLAGEYVCRLIADDGQVKSFDDVTVTVIEPTRVDISAAAADAAELGPDTGQFTITRYGDTMVDLTVFLTLGGTASNGVDYLELTNVVLFPAGSDTVSLVVTPYLDHRTEGPETVLFTIVSNLAYSIGSGEATVTIQDSPYGTWNVAHFTLEELTDPKLSGETADFDHDGLINFVEYAFHREPKVADTNAPLLTALALDSTNGPSHITLTYQRRLEPTDTVYEPAVSYDLVTWNVGTNYLGELQAVADGNNLTETVTARLVEPCSTATNLFLTIRVWQRSTRP